MLTESDMADNITALNFLKPFLFGKIKVTVSREWFTYCVKYGYLDKCNFDIIVSSAKYSPFNPIIDYA